MINLTSFLRLAKFSIYNLLQLTKVIQDPIIYHRLPIDLFPFFREKKKFELDVETFGLAL